MGPSLPRLTSLSSGGGCACKLPAQELRELVGTLQPADDHLLVGPHSGDDAAVMASSVAGQATVFTADFFSAVVDDPRQWGRIAATNALSDIYAMGGIPQMGLNLLAWPQDVLPMNLAAEVLAGAQEVCRAAECVVGGGHSVKGVEPMFGMAVLGTVNTAELIRIDQARPGMPLTLTKPLGLGILNAWHRATAEISQPAVEVMTTLNAAASAAARQAGIVAGTDVTGYGLLGHLMNICRASSVSAEIDPAAVPVLPDALRALQAGHLPGGSRRNRQGLAASVDNFADDQTMDILCDAQTSGGLLLAGHIPGHPVIGRITTSSRTPRITIKPQP